MTLLLRLLVVLLLATGGWLIVANVRRLIADWPRLKPVHNVDVTWIKVYFGAALLVLAWFIATDPAAKLRERVPNFTSQEGQERNVQKASAQP